MLVEVSAGASSMTRSHLGKLRLNLKSHALKSKNAVKQEFHVNYHVPPWWSPGKHDLIVSDDALGEAGERVHRLPGRRDQRCHEAIL